MKTHEVTLPNGLKVIFVNTRSFPTVSTLLLVGAGSRYENKVNNGIAHFFEHMAFKGSQKYPSSYVISSTIEGLGGVFNAFTSKDHTGYWIKSTVEHFPTVIDVIADMVLHPLLVPDEINREKGVIVEEINMYEDMPYRKVGDIYEELLYRGNPLGYDIAGSKSTVTQFDRKTFTDYIGHLYHPENAVLVIAGGFGLEHEEASKLKSFQVLVEEKFAAWKKGKHASFLPMSVTQSKPELLVHEKKTEQAHVCIGYRAFSFHDKRKPVLSVLTAVLGGGMSSRLFMEVRERRGLCYYISTGRELYEDVGGMVTQAGITNNTEKVSEAIKVILEEHEKVAAGSVTKEELVKAKELIKGRLLLSLEDSFNVAAQYGTKKLLEGLTETPEQILARIDAVTVSDVTDLAKELFVPAGLNAAVIGPFNKLPLTDIFGA